MVEFLLPGMFSSKWLLVYILVFAFLIRLSGIGYGLPLWVIDDEPPFTLAALLMLKLKTVIPAFHLADFSRVLYYPPYLSYLYLIPFGILGLGHYLLFQGGTAQFADYLTVHIDQFFLIARFVNILLGAISVWLAYRISLSLFRDMKTALISAFLLATSLVHILFSFTGRHWLPISFVYILGFYFLCKENWSMEKRYCSAIVTAGIGMGVSPITALFTPLIALWYFAYDGKSIKELLVYKKIIFATVLFAGLAWLPGLLYPRSFGFVGDVTAEQAKTFWGIFSSVFLFLKPVFLSDPAIGIFAVIGLAFLWRFQKRLALAMIIFLYGYSIVFYELFRFEHRFSLPLIPFLAILAGYGIVKLSGYVSEDYRNAAIAVLMLFPLIFAFRFGYLALKNDSRIALRQWIEENIPEGSKIMVSARLMRLASNPVAIAEQRAIDTGSLRSIDIAEERGFGSQPSYHAFNLYSVSNPVFYENMLEYAQSNSYQYLVMSDADSWRNPNQFAKVSELSQTGTLIRSYGNSQEEYSISIGQLLGNPLGLFRIDQFGPLVELYKLY